MASLKYMEALKLGRKNYQECIEEGKYPYLPVLDSILPAGEIASETSLGVVDVPLSRIVGTKTEGRTTAFASNYMPLLAPNSEFSSKWSNLYDYQVEEGIQDPILVYEYMNRFYVLEGNKRVSVMKFLGAYSIQGEVIRLLPKKNDSKEYRIYCEFMEFYDLAHNNDVWFSREGSYKKLLKLVGKAQGEEWSEDDRIIFNSAYGRFDRAFGKSGQEMYRLNRSDVFLIYTELLGYDVVSHQTEKEMQQALTKVKKEIELADSGHPVELVESPEEVEETTPKPTLLNWLLSGTIQPEQLRIAFLYTKTAEASSWTYAHELGRQHLNEVYGGKLQTMAFDKVDSDLQVRETIEQAIRAGCNMIFTTAPQMVKQSVSMALLHPEVKIYNCSINLSYSAICTYYARMYEAKFLMGAIAAALSKTGKLGYVADYPIYGTLANINAFALGARMIDPDVKVYLEWSRTRDANAMARLEREGITFISGDDMITPQKASREYGLFHIKENGERDNYATPIWHWGKFYERIVKQVCQGADEKGVAKGKKAVNYWWGMSADVIDVICSKDIPHGTHRLIDFLKNSIRAGSFHPFDGLIYSQNGVIRCREGESLSPEEIISMNWLAENVVGQVPLYMDLNDEARDLVRLQGVREEEREDSKE